jgi:hypothetical protein
MIENREQATELRGEVHTLKQMCRALENKIKSFTNFNGGNTSLDFNLGHAIAFLDD